MGENEKAVPHRTTDCMWAKKQKVEGESEIPRVNGALMATLAEIQKSGGRIGFEVEWNHKLGSRHFDHNL